MERCLGLERGSTRASSRYRRACSGGTVFSWVQSAYGKLPPPSTKTLLHRGEPGGGRKTSLDPTQLVTKHGSTGMNPVVANWSCAIDGHSSSERHATCVFSWTWCH